MCDGNLDVLVSHIWSTARTKCDSLLAGGRFFGREDTGISIVGSLFGTCLSDGHKFRRACNEFQLETSSGTYDCSLVVPLDTASLPLPLLFDLGPQTKSRLWVRVHLKVCSICNLCCVSFNAFTFIITLRDKLNLFLLL